MYFCKYTFKLLFLETTSTTTKAPSSTNQIFTKQKTDKDNVIENPINDINNNNLFRNRQQKPTLIKKTQINNNTDPAEIENIFTKLESDPSTESSGSMFIKNNALNNNNI